MLQNNSTASSDISENHRDLNLPFFLDKKNLSRPNEVSQPEVMESLVQPRYAGQPQNAGQSSSKRNFQSLSPSEEQSFSAFESYSKPHVLSTISSSHTHAALLSTFSIIANFEPAKSVPSTPKPYCTQNLVSDQLGSSGCSEQSFPSFQNQFPLDLDRVLKSSPTSTQKLTEDNASLQDLSSKSLPGIRLPPLHLPCPEDDAMLNRSDETFILPKTSQQMNSQSIEVS